MAAAVNVDLRRAGRLAMGLAALAILQGCGCTTYSNRLIIGRRPPVIVQLQECDLRMAVNPSLSSVARALGFFTTPFKRAGVFGWRDAHIDAVAVGIVVQVAASTDHFVTADLRLIALTANGVPVTLQSERYLRSEICARRLQLPAAAWPRPGDKVRISGRVLWDSDGRGFLEIHPQRNSDVEIFERAGSCR